MKILLVEDDQTTSSILTTALTAHHYTINHAADGDAGLKLAEAVEYDLILLDVMIPKLDGISLCKQLRAQGCQTPILLLAAKDSLSDRELGLDAGADDYVIKPFEIDELLERIRALQRRNTHRHAVQAATSKIWEKFKPRFMEQFAVLEQMAVALTADKLTDELQQHAVQEAHKLAGALGIFGSMQGSQLARELETLLRSQTPLGSEHADHVSAVVDLLQQVLQQSAKPVEQPAPVLHTPLILIVDDDLTLAERIRIEAIAWGLQVEVATDLQIARTAIAQTSPDVVLLDLNFPSPAERGMDLLQELMQRVPKIPVLVFTGQGGLEDRLQVSRLGECVFLQKPLPIYEILKAVTNLLTQQQTRHRNRVLAIDDAPAVLEKLCSLLQPLGIQVTALEQPQHFWQVLTATEPNLLILDLEMPGINGIELCQAVRSDPKWHDLPILFLSAHTEAKEIDRAFAAGADDYISKSVEETELVTRIIRRLRRAGFQES